MTIFGVSVPTLRAVMRRELTTTRHNRFVQVLALVVLAGSGAVAASSRPDAVPFGVLLLFLYVVPLFGLLVGVSAAHEDREELPFLLSQPVPRRAYVLGKAGVLTAALMVVLLLALIPPAVAVAAAAPVLLLGGLGAVLACISVSGGIALGHYTGTRARGLMAALLTWFAVFGLYDVLALALSGLGVMQQLPALWVAVLLLNPIDAVRLTGLFGLEQVPFSVAGAAAWIEPLTT
ncbi:MAG: hypothetical protein GVY12_00960, partial [Bacteroidetes bacterium]|nr:hypothetical protein [Bacteroidota bacterium]